MAAIDLTTVTLPHVGAAVAMTTTADELTIGPHVSAVYLYVDDATDPGIGRVATDGTNFHPLRGRTPELIYAKPAGGLNRDPTVQIKLSAGTANGYLRVF